MLRCTVKLRGFPDLYPYVVAVAVGPKMYVFGRYYSNARTTEDQINVYVFNTVSLRWIMLPPVKTTREELPPKVPRILFFHTAVLIEDIVYIWGGENMRGLYNNVFYAFHVDTHRWLNYDVSGTVPEARRGHSACALGKVMYVYGGETKLTSYTNDIYKLDTTTMVWSLINTGGSPPPVSSCHSATIIGTKMYVFGGLGDEGDCNNVCVFDAETNYWLNTPSAPLPPIGRESHSAFAYNAELYIFGGENLSYEAPDPDTCTDMWRFSPETFSWKEVKPKVNDSFWMNDGCFCMVGNRVIIFGGCKGDDTPNDYLFILDLSPSLKTLCKLAVIQYGLEQSELPHDIRWELAAMTDGELADSA